MKSIAKKSKNVKRKKGQKPPQTPLRYTLKKDSLGRRYATDKRTGQRVSIYKAEKERAQRRETQKPFRGITPPKQPKKQKPTLTRQKRSEAAKKGWETRRRKAAIAPIAPLITEQQLFELAEQEGFFTIPPERRMRVLGGIADRAELYPMVENAATEGLAKLWIEFGNRRLARLEKRPEPPLTQTPRFDRLFGPGLSGLIRERMAGARDLQDIDQIIEDMAEDPDYSDIPVRELYRLHFSPEVA